MGLMFHWKFLQALRLSLDIYSSTGLGKKFFIRWLEVATTPGALHNMKASYAYYAYFVCYVYPHSHLVDSSGGKFGI